MKILIIEDEKKMAAILKQGLEEHAFVVDLAFDGEEGLYMAENFPYDAVLLDIRMPGLDGFETARRLRATPGFEELAILVVSASAYEEVLRLQEAVAAKRRAVEEFRVRHSIVSPEREENSILAEMQGLAAAQKEANKRLTEAEGKAESLRAAAAQGKGVVRARDNPTLAALEARASQIREELREMGRRYTPEYLEMDPQARALRVRLAELEEQIKAQRAVGQSSALEEAEQELAAARESTRRLQLQIAAGKQQVGAFAARFSQYKSLQEELGQLEKAYQEALQRQVRLGATQRSRAPALQILEQAVIPKEPWRPPGVWRRLHSISLLHRHHSQRSPGNNRWSHLLPPYHHKC